MTIEQKAEEMLRDNDVLIEVLKSRNAYGLKKYGKSLDDNDIPERERAIHAIQEGLDLLQYLIWLGWDNKVDVYEIDYTRIISKEILYYLQSNYCLTAQEIIEGGKK